MNLRTTINMRHGSFLSQIHWKKYAEIDLQKLFQRLQEHDWCVPLFDVESRARSYVNIQVISNPQSFNTGLGQDFLLKFNVFANGKIVLWERNCGKNLPKWLDKFFLYIILFCLREKR